MFGAFGNRGHQQSAEVLPDTRDDLVRQNIEDTGDCIVIAQYQTTRVRHMWSSYKR